MAHRSGPLLRISVAALALALMTAAGAAARKTPDVQAKLTFDKVGYEYRSVELLIVRRGSGYVRRLGRTYFTPPKLHVSDLDADGESEIWVDTYTGGAHCCFQSRFFHYVPARRTYAGTFRDWGNVGYRAKNLDGRDGVELVSSDDRFAYVFTDFADSFFPLQIWQLDRGRLLDVTSRFPGQVELDANVLWRTYLERRRKGDVRGVLAAWIADQYLLGLDDSGWQALEEAKKRGELGGNSGWPSGPRYLRALRAYLVKLGYASR
jgi:hypothetical protein